MLVCTTNDGDYIVVGRAVIHVTAARNGGRTRLAVDAPEDVEIIRSREVEELLVAAGFALLGDGHWWRGGVPHTLRSALNEVIPS